MKFSNISPQKIGLLVIATGKYISFVGPLWESAKKFFMTDTPHKVTMFVFTDMPEVPIETIRIEQEALKWPGPTLMRYHIFSKHEKLLEQQDYLYYSDADMRFEGKVGEEILGELVATKHPGFWNQPYSVFSQSYEKRTNSQAYMPPGYGKEYYAGGFNGGRAKRFLQMSKEIKGWIDIDLKNGIIACWHDESHLNKYMTGNGPSIVLSPSYCYQEGTNLPFEKKLVALNKNHEELRK